MISTSAHGRRAVMPVMIAAISALACARVTETTAPGQRVLTVRPAMDTSPIRFSMPTRPGQLTAEQTASIASRIASLRAEPARLVIRVGDTVSVPTLVRILAFDSAGAPLGELNRYDFTTRGSPLFLLRDGRMWAREIGTSEFRVSFPRRLWAGDPATRPEVTVPIDLSATGRTSPRIGPR